MAEKIIDISIYPRVIDGQPVYVDHGPTNRLVSGALKRIEGLAGQNGFGDLQGLSQSILLVPDEERVVHLTTDHLMDIASHLEPESADQILDLATEIETTWTGRDYSPRIAEDNSENQAFDRVRQTLLTHIDTVTISSGETFEQDRERLAQMKAKEAVDNALQKANQPFRVVAQETQSSLGEKLSVKEEIKEGLEDPIEIREITAEITAIKANLIYCQRFIEKDASWENFEEVAKELMTEIQDEVNQITIGEVEHLEDHEILESETKLQALISLQGQFKDASRRRQNAIEFFHGSPDKPNSGLLHEAAAQRRKKLSQETTDQGVPLINALVSGRLGAWMQSEFEARGLGSKMESALILYEQVTGDNYLLRELIQEIAESTPVNADSSISDFLAETYCTSLENTVLDTIKGHASDLIVSAVNETFNIDVREKYKVLLEEVTFNVTENDLVEILAVQEKQAITTKLVHEAIYIMDFLQIHQDARVEFLGQNIEAFIKTLLASHEITTRANDGHLNPRVVLENIVRGAFLNEPVSLQTVRCLRWCYPNKKLEITPHAGDWQTLSTDGRPIVRKEWVDREKLVRHSEAVVVPFLHYGIPIRDIVLLAAGDYDLVGEGFGYIETDEPAINAQAYIEDARRRVPEWNVYGSLPIRVTSFKEMIDNYGKEEFNALLAEIRTYYNELFVNPRLNYAGYTAQSLERLIDAEHNTRIPFIAGWTRERSRQLVRHRLTMDLAISVLIAQQQQDYPVIVTVSGTQPAASSFARGHLVKENAPRLGITLFQSINDGDQPGYYQTASTVVE